MTRKPSGKNIFLSILSERLLWVDKYRPLSTKQLVGEKGVSSNASKLSKWLQNWEGDHMGGGEGVPTSRKTHSKSARGKDKCSHKAVLLAGPPGVGKTTTAQLVCKVTGAVVYIISVCVYTAHKGGRGVSCDILLQSPVPIPPPPEF